MSVDGEGTIHALVDWPEDYTPDRAVREVTLLVYSLVRGKLTANLTEAVARHPDRHVGREVLRRLSLLAAQKEPPVICPTRVFDAPNQ